MDAMMVMIKKRIPNPMIPAPNEGPLSINPLPNSSDMIAAMSSTTVRGGAKSVTIILASGIIEALTRKLNSKRIKPRSLII